MAKLPKVAKYCQCCQQVSRFVKNSPILQKKNCQKLPQAIRNDDNMTKWQDNTITRWHYSNRTTQWHGDTTTRNKMTIIIQRNLPPPKNGRHAYGFGICSYDPYTKHSDEDDNKFWWNIIISHRNLPPPKNGRHAYGFATCSYDPYTKHNDED